MYGRVVLVQCMVGWCWYSVWWMVLVQCMVDDVGTVYGG